METVPVRWSRKQYKYSMGLVVYEQVFVKQVTDRKVCCSALMTVRWDKTRGAAGKSSVSEEHVGNELHQKSIDVEADWQLVQLWSAADSLRDMDVSFLTRILISTVTNNVYCKLMMYYDWIIWCSYGVLMYACVFIVQAHRTNPYSDSTPCQLLLALSMFWLFQHE